MKGEGNRQGRSNGQEKEWSPRTARGAASFSLSLLLSYTVTVIVCTIEAMSWDKERRSTGEIHIKGM